VFHGRAELSALWVEHTRALGLEVFASVTCGDTANIAVLRDIVHVEAPNEPLGAKHNAALALVPPDVDGVMILPSDDFVHPQYVERAKAALGAGADYVYPFSCGMYEVSTGKACILVQPPSDGALRFGAGRVVSRKALDSVGPLWTEARARGLDSDSHARIRAHGFRPTFVDLGPDVPCLTDVKSGVNLWPYHTWARKGRAVGADVVLGMCSPSVHAGVLALGST